MLMERVTFHHLTNSGIGPYPYRAGLRNLRTCGETMTVEHTTKTVGYAEYTDILKLLCAMGGFFWPSAGKKARRRISRWTRSSSTGKSVNHPDQEDHRTGNQHELERAGDVALEQ
jgi:hypothetical protein